MVREKKGMTKRNCRNMVRCSREPGGTREMDRGVYPAAQSGTYNGIHDG